MQLLWCTVLLMGLRVECDQNNLFEQTRDKTVTLKQKSMEENQEAKEEDKEPKKDKAKGPVAPSLGLSGIFYSIYDKKTTEVEYLSLEGEKLKDTSTITVNASDRVGLKDWNLVGTGEFPYFPNSHLFKESLIKPVEGKEQQVKCIPAGTTFSVIERSPAKIIAFLVVAVLAAGVGANEHTKR